MRAYQDMVFTTAARLMGNDTQAEDIAQEVFLKAHEHFDDLKKSPTAGGWLKTVATNLSLNYLTRYRRRWRFFSELKPAGAEESAAPLEMPAPGPGAPLAEICDSQRAALIETALSKLPAQQRLPLVLYHFEDLSYDEIAARLGASLAKIKTDMRRGRAALVPYLQTAGITTSVDD